MNNHGVYAKIGDLVEIYDDAEKSTGITGVVYDVEKDDRTIFREPPRRYLWITGINLRLSDWRARIISEAKTDGRD